MMGGQEEVKQLEECSVAKRRDNSSVAMISSCGSLLEQIGFVEFMYMFTFIFLHALGTWVFSVVGALVAIPVGIKRKSLAPLVFFGTTGTMLDIILGISACEREHAERQMKLLEAQNAAADASLAGTTSES